MIDHHHQEKEVRKNEGKKKSLLEIIFIVLFFLFSSSSDDQKVDQNQDQDRVHQHVKAERNIQLIEIEKIVIVKKKNVIEINSVTVVIS
jgi:hypothetical protein